MIHKYNCKFVRKYNKMKILLSPAKKLDFSKEISKLLYDLSFNNTDNWVNNKFCGLF